MTDWSAEHIARELKLDPPTDQQIAVIQAPVAGPALVVAGAGSGKTETMAGRVLWLLANGHAKPAQVLGLTFTRKAAGELSARMGKRIAQLVAAGIIEPDDDLDPPQIATYNSYANRLYRDNASAIGREGDGAVLGEAAAWQLARTTVTRSADLRLLDQDRSLDALTEAVLGISRAIADNVADPDAIRSLAHEFAGVMDLPLGARAEYAWVRDVVENVGQLELLVDLALEYDAAKRRRGFVEYSDQVALALEILRAKPSLVEEQREEHRIVLLDEYQDTSVTQAWLLSELFRSEPGRAHSVMAVGDPNQSIYGWRGASAGNLAAFPLQFGGDAHFSLSMSWRNGRRILDVANRLVEPFRVGAAVEVEKLVPRPDAGTDPVGISFRQTVKDEAETVARWLDDKLAEPGGPHSAALLMRARKNQPVFLAALRERGVRYHVLGVGGLLAEPEVADVVSALSVVHSVDAGMELLRLLAGSRWRLGAGDLHELGQLSSVLKSRGIDQRTLPDEVRERMRNSLAEGERGSIVDALDFLATARDERSEWERFSPLGRERLRDAGQVFARLRSLAGLELPDFVSAVVHELRLDIEVASNPYRTLGPAPLE
ncbi:MAG: ATP-dependent helicase, partial [Schumannella sp.]|nr:ATP-dependent helicase [Schumannella sp.]